jgi:peptide/nickel transport system substrate-binding protein
LAEVAAAVTTQLQARRERATALVVRAREAIQREQFKEAYPLLVEAFNLEPELPGTRDLIDHCLASIQVLEYGDFDDPQTLDPITAVKAVELRLGQFLYEGLINRDPEERFVFELARDVRIDATGTIFDFILHPDLRWSDGQNFSARDVAFTLQLLTDTRTAGYNPAFAQFIEKVEVLSPLELRVRLRRPFYRPLSLFSFKVVPRHAFSEEFLEQGHPFSRRPIGSGPFIYSEGFGSRSIELVRNPHYRQPGKPYLAGVRLKRYHDRQSGRNDLERGEIHLLSELRPLDVDFFDKQRNNFTVLQYRTRTVYFLACNYRSPLFRDNGVELRRAIAHAIDRQQILEQYFNAGNPLKRRGGQAHSVITGPFPYNSWAYDDRVPGYRYDPTLAAGLLADVLSAQGWSREGDPRATDARNYWRRGDQELELRLKYPLGDLNVEKACVFIADSLKKLGIKVRLAQKAPRDLHDEVVGRHDFDLVYARYDYDDTYDALPLFDPRRNEPGGSNYAGYVDPTLVKLFEALQTTRNPSRIQALAQRIHAHCHERCVFVFLWQLDQYAAHLNDLRNVEVHPYLLFGNPSRWKLLRGLGR